MLPIALKHKTWVTKKRLSHDVYVQPSKVKRDEVSIEFKQIDKNKIVIDNTGFRFEPLFYVFVGAITAKESYYPLHMLSIWNVFSLLFFVFAFVSVLYFIFFPKKFVIFDRNKGTVSIPGPIWFKNVEVPFKEVVAVIQREVNYYARSNVLKLYRPDGFGVDVGINNYSLEALGHDWAFYVWYMDKDRPLPPAPVFETDRQPSAAELDGTDLSGQY